MPKKQPRLKKAQLDLITPKELIEESIASRIAYYMMLGMKNSAIASKLREIGIDITTNGVVSIARGEECKRIIRNTSTELQEQNEATIVAGANELLRLAFDVLKQNLDDGNLNAAELVFKLVAKNQTEAKADTSITVIMPGAEEKPVNVTPDIIVENTK